MPRPMKIFYLYSIEDWKRSKRTGEYIYAEGATYSKTIEGAIKTFKDNHYGMFMVVSERKAVEVMLAA